MALTTNRDETMSHRILVVDDDILVLEALQELLTSSGYEVRVATRGQEALEMLDQQEFDLLILDVVMPKMTGLDVCKEVRKRGDEMSKVKIILLTAKTEPKDVKVKEKYGCDLYLTKPIDAGKLKELIRDTLEGSIE
ncbi:MAG: response regulator [Desulfobacterales bacterium]|nr:response regulator [Desulfobacterales bacterium]